MAIILVPSLLRNVTTQSKTFHKKPYLSQTKLKPHPSSLESQETISARRCEHAASLLASCLDIGGIFFCFGGGGGGGGGGPPGPTPKFPIDATSGFRADLSLYIYRLSKSVGNHGSSNTSIALFFPHQYGTQILARLHQVFGPFCIDFTSCLQT